MRRCLYLLVVLSVVLAFAGCEDDPIVGPTEDDGSSGSYGNIQQLPADTSSAKVETTRSYNPTRF